MILFVASSLKVIIKYFVTKANSFFEKEKKMIVGFFRNLLASLLGFFFFFLVTYAELVFIKGEMQLCHLVQGGSYPKGFDIWIN